MWWVSTLLISTGLFWSYYTGIVSEIWQKDSSYITSIIIITFFIGTLCIGWATKSNVDNSINKKSLFDTAWFLSDFMMGLGMAGTVIGIIQLLGIDQSVNVQNPEALSKLINEMWSTMGVAFYPNALGILGSLTLKLQTHLFSK